jgi:inhibitor of cysteine peptidase
MAGTRILLTLVTLSVVAGLTTAVAAVAADEPPPLWPDAMVVSVDCASFAAEPSVTRSVAVEPGSSIVLSLCSSPTTGYRWTEPVSSDPAIAYVGGWSYTAPESDLLGAPGAELVTIAARAPGTAVVSASYGQPWDGGDKGAWSIELTVEVSDANALVIGCDEFEATPAVSRSVDLAVGESLVVSLCSNPTTGFRWSGATSSDPAVAAVSGWKYEEPSDETGMVGVAGTEHLTLDGLAAGDAVITASYDQPWDGGDKGGWSLELSVRVD